MPKVLIGRMNPRTQGHLTSQKFGISLYANSRILLREENKYLLIGLDTKTNPIEVMYNRIDEVVNAPYFNN